MNLCCAFFAAALLFVSSCSKGQPSPPVDEVSTPVPVVANTSPFGLHLAINGFEWDFSDQDNSVISEGRMAVIRSFSAFRHYLEWDKIESNEGLYTFNPTHAGSWNYDMIYQRAKAENIDMLTCLKSCPSWLQNTYPADMRDAENVPAPYGLDRSDPASYIKQAKAGFQFAARYGYNTKVDPALVTVNAKQRWTNDGINVVKIGLGYVKFIECDNERDKTWKGDKAHQNAEEYAANMSAFYDGHLGKLGKGVGVKAADPTMKVVMGGLSVSGPEYVVKMIAWCKKNRGLNADGSVNLCFDVINYHYYSNNSEGTRGSAPELSTGAKKAADYIAMSKANANGMEVWLTESGYDLNEYSNQRVVPIGDKPIKIIQADWSLRSAFLNERQGLKRTYFYMLDDVDSTSTTQYASSGFSVGHKRRPVADYFLQTKKLLGDFTFSSSLSTDPVVDVYVHDNRKIYVLYVPDQKNRKVNFTLDMGSAKKAKLYQLVPGADDLSQQEVSLTDGKWQTVLTETPVFIEKL